MDLNSKTMDNLISGLSKGGRNELDYIKAVGDLSKKHEGNPNKVSDKAVGEKVEELRESSHKMHSNTVQNRAEDLEKAGTANYIRTNSQGKPNFHQLTEKGWKIYEQIQGLYQNMEEVKEAIREVRNSRHDYKPSLEEVELELGRPISEEVLLKAESEIKEQVEREDEKRRARLDKIAEEAEEEMEKELEEISNNN